MPTLRSEEMRCVTSPTAILLNIGHAMDHWIIVIFAYTWGVIAGVWGVEWTELTPVQLRRAPSCSAWARS